MDFYGKDGGETVVEKKLERTDFRKKTHALVAN
jgi:hypothetical protein